MFQRVEICKGMEEEGSSRENLHGCFVVLFVALRPGPHPGHADIHADLPDLTRTVVSFF